MKYVYYLNMKDTTVVRILALRNQLMNIYNPYSSSTCLHTSIHKYHNIHIHIHRNQYVHIHTHRNQYIHIHIHRNQYTHSYIYKYTTTYHTCMYITTIIYMYYTHITYVYTDIHVHVLLLVHTYTYTQITPPQYSDTYGIYHDTDADTCPLGSRKKYGSVLGTRSFIFMMVICNLKGKLI